MPLSFRCRRFAILALLILSYGGQPRPAFASSKLHLEPSFRFTQELSEQDSPGTNEDIEKDTNEQPNLNSEDSEIFRPEVASALAEGDLQKARWEAVKQRKADPSPATWRQEALVHEARADYPAAIYAWKAYLQTLPEQASEEARFLAKERIAELEEESRGAVVDEPASTHRQELDAERAEKQQALLPPPKPTPLAPKPKVDEIKITRKWYFWVTIAAITASAAAITGIAIKGALDQRNDTMNAFTEPTGFAIRF